MPLFVRVHFEVRANTVFGARDIVGNLPQLGFGSSRRGIRMETLERRVPGAGASTRCC